MRPGLYGSEDGRYSANMLTAHCSHGQGFLVPVVFRINTRERATQKKTREREEKGAAGQEVMYSSVPRIRSLNALRP